MSFFQSRYFKPTRFKIIAKRILFYISAIFLMLLIYTNVIGESKELENPVQGATQESWNSESYWHTAWGASKVHKGIDIFAPHKTLIKSPINGFILSAGYSTNGGNYLYILGPKFRIYYFAHLNIQENSSFSFVKKGKRIGLVGNSGNAIGTPYHLHFSILSLFPVIENYTRKEPFGWMKMFYLDPVKSLTSI